MPAVGGHAALLKVRHCKYKCYK